MTKFGDKVSFIWNVADLLRGPYKPAQYGRVILPLTVLRRLDCVLEPTKEKVLAASTQREVPVYGLLLSSPWSESTVSYSIDNNNTHRTP